MGSVQLRILKEIDEAKRILAVWELLPVLVNG